MKSATTVNMNGCNGHTIHQSDPPSAGSTRCLNCEGWIVAGRQMYMSPVIGGMFSHGPYCVPCFLEIYPEADPT